MKDVPGLVHYGHKDLTPLTDTAWCLAFCRRFGVPYARLPSTATHHSGCDSSAGVNGAHAIVCPSSRAQRTWRHNRVRDAFAFVARKFGFQVYTNGRRDAPTYEFSFRTDEHGIPTSKRSDLHITDERGRSYILDVTICVWSDQFSNFSLCQSQGSGTVRFPACPSAALQQPRQDVQKDL